MPGIPQSRVHMGLHAAENVGVGTDLHVGRVEVWESEGVAWVPHTLLLAWGPSWDSHLTPLSP